MSRLIRQHAPAIISALVTAAITIGASIFTVGKDLGRAEAEAEYWYRYSQGLNAKPECR